MNFKPHYISGSISALFIIWIVIILIITKLRFVRSEFIFKVDPVHPYIYSYWCFLRMIVQSILLLFGNSTNYNILYLIAFIFEIYQVKTKISKNWKEEHTKRKITEDILNDLTFEEGYTDSEGSDCNQIQTSDSPQYLLDYFDEVQELETETACLGSFQGEHSMTMNAMMNYVMLYEISF